MARTCSAVPSWESSSTKIASHSIPASTSSRRAISGSTLPRSLKVGSTTVSSTGPTRRRVSTGVLGTSILSKLDSRLTEGIKGKAGICIDLPKHGFEGNLEIDLAVDQEIVEEIEIATPERAFGVIQRIRVHLLEVVGIVFGKPAAVALEPTILRRQEKRRGIERPHEHPVDEDVPLRGQQQRRVGKRRCIQFIKPVIP